MKRRLLSIITLAFITLFIASCDQDDDTELQPRELSEHNIDTSVKPGDDFFLYANGKWYDTATILPTESRAGARLEMDYIAKSHIRAILEETSKEKTEPGSIEQKVGDMYASGMDTAAIEKLHFDPIKPWLQQIDTLSSIKSLLQFIAMQTTLGNDLLIGQFIGADEKNSNKNITVYYQDGLGLPDRDYYFKTDAATLNVVAAYQKYIRTLFMLTGDDAVTAEKNEALVYDIEKQLAASHRTNVELRDPQSNYNKMAVADLDKKMTVLGWQALLANLLVKTDSVNLSQPAYYAKLNELLKTIPLNSWKTYLRFHLIDNTANILSSSFMKAAFEYRGQTLSGQKQMKERWEQLYRMIDYKLGEALGQLYVQKYFTEDSKKRINELVDNLIRAFQNRIKNLDWMSDSTKQKALEKTTTFVKKVAYPDNWRDYSSVSITRSSYFNNVMACSKNEYSYQVNKLGKPVNRSEWGMTPPTNNAYYNATVNEIVFPAGILQFPMFDPGSDDAMNYGGIGMVIGHEITHGFDDQGAQYDKYGNLSNWWSKEDAEKFKAKGQQVVELYNKFTVLDSLHVNGKLTLGENMADIGGIAIAYDAFKLTQQGQDTTRIQDFTPDQRFFLSFAQCWRKKIKDEAMRQQVNTDPHSPGMYRVIGPLMNFTPFYKAFNVKEGDKMFVAEKDRIKIW
jgi:putative endopeptidase